MYPNLNAELTQRDLTVCTISQKLGIPPAKLRDKLAGLVHLTFDEARQIKAVLETDRTLEFLFRRATT